MVILHFEIGDISGIDKAKIQVLGLSSITELGISFEVPDTISEIFLFSGEIFDNTSAAIKAESG